MPVHFTFSSFSMALYLKLEGDLNDSAKAWLKEYVAHLLLFIYIYRSRYLSIYIYIYIDRSSVQQVLNGTDFQPWNFTSKTTLILIDVEKIKQQLHSYCPAVFILEALSKFKGLFKF